MRDTPTAATEINVHDAATDLGVSERTVINYIRGKQLEATKVGKAWFINHKSYLDFKNNFGSLLNPRGDKQREAALGLSNKKPRYSVTQLRMFQLVSEAYSFWLKHFYSKDPNSSVHRGIHDQMLVCIRLIGSGYHAFEKEHKRRFYIEAKAQLAGVSALAGLLSLHDQGIEQWSEHIETELLPAFSSLIRKVEGRIKAKGATSS
jgi:hypothetical protein